MGSANSNLDSTAEIKPFNYSTLKNDSALKSQNVNIKRSKSYAIPENQVLPSHFIGSKLRPLNKFKSDGLKKTWKRNNELNQESFVTSQTNTEFPSKFPFNTKTFLHCLSDNNDDSSLDSNSSMFSSAFTNSTLLSYQNDNDSLPLAYFNRNPKWESSIFSKKQPLVFSNKLKLGSQVSFVSKKYEQLVNANMNSTKHSNISNDSNFILKPKQETRENTFIRVKTKQINKQKSCNLKTKRKCIDEVFPQIDLRSQSLITNTLNSIASNSANCNSSNKMNWFFASSTTNDASKRFECNRSYSSNEYEAINDDDNNNNNNEEEDDNLNNDYPLEKLNILY